MKKDKLSVLNESLSDIIIIYQASNGRYLEVIGGADKSVYSDASFLVGKTVFEVLPKDKAELIMRHIDYSMQIDNSVEFEYDLNHNDLGSSELGVQWYRAKIMPFRDKDNSIYGVPAATFMATNITKEKLLEREIYELVELDINAPIKVLNRLAFKDIEDSLTKNIGLEVSVVEISLRNAEFIEAAAKSLNDLNRLEKIVYSKLDLIKDYREFYIGRFGFGRYKVLGDMKKQALLSSVQGILKTLGPMKIELKNGDYQSVIFDVS